MMSGYHEKELKTSISLQPKNILNAMGGSKDESLINNGSSTKTSFIRRINQHGLPGPRSINRFISSYYSGTLEKHITY